MLRHILPARIWLLALLLIAGLAAVFYFVLGQGAKSSVVGQLLMREQILARSESSNIVSFFQVFGQSMVVLAQLGSVQKQDASTVLDMDAFIDQWRSSGLVDGVILAGKNGVVRFNSNILGTRDIGTSVADRDYFLWAQTQTKQGGFFVGQPVISRLGASKGKVIVPVAAAVYEDGVFQGVLTAAVNLGALTQYYLGLMKISKSTEVYLFDQNGTFLYSAPGHDVEGLNVFDQLQSNRFLGSQVIADSLKIQLANPQEGQLQVTYLDPQTNGLEVRLMAYAPVNLGNQKWLLVMASPFQDALGIINSFYIRQAALFLFTAVIILSFGAVASWDRQKTLSK